MHERDCNRSLSNSRRNAFDIAAANIAHREHAGLTRFEEVRKADKWPACGGQILRRQVWSGLDESFGVQRNTPIQPVRIGPRSSHDEHVADVVGLDLPRLIVPPPDAFQMLASSDPPNLPLPSQYDLRTLFH